MVSERGVDEEGRGGDVAHAGLVGEGYRVCKDWRGVAGDPR